jgi:pimeloyl-ACP methyl ester carboxylesterase
MTSIILVPGAWLGSWAWDEVIPPLTAAGHDVHALTLPGLAERAVGDPAAVGLAEHVRAVREYLTEHALTGTLLVGYSYSGLVTGQVAAAEPERVGHAVFLDANLPAAGESMVDAWAKQGRAFDPRRLAADGGYWKVPPASVFEGQGLTAEQIALLLQRGTDQPARTITDPALLARPLAELHATYIKCLKPNPRLREDVAAALASPTWTLVELDTGHWPNFSRPAELAALLAAISAELPA